MEKYNLTQELEEVIYYADIRWKRNNKEENLIYWLIYALLRKNCMAHHVMDSLGIYSSDIKKYIPDTRNNIKFELNDLFEKLKVKTNNKIGSIAFAIELLNVIKNSNDKEFIMYLRKFNIEINGLIHKLKLYERDSIITLSDGTIT